MRGDWRFEVWGLRGGRLEAHSGVSCELWALRVERQLEAWGVRLVAQA